MRNMITVVALVLGASSALATNDAQAADGAVCFSSILTQTSQSGFGKTYTPQITNNTKFTCANSTTYTLKQLSQAGWIIDNMMPVVWSSELKSDGSAILKTRWQITIQK